MQKIINVLIPDSEGHFSLFTAHCLSREKNIRVHFIGSSPWLPSRFSVSCASYTVIRAGLNDADRLESILNVIKKQQIDVYLPTDTRAIDYAIRHRHALSAVVALAPLPDEKVFGIANNKWLLAKFLAENDLPGPPTELVVDVPELGARLANLRYPLLLKPINARDGDGIIRFDALEPLLRYIDTRKPEFFGRCIAQSITGGRVVGMNVLAKDGKLLAHTLQMGIIPNTKKFAAAGAIAYFDDSSYLPQIEKFASVFFHTGFANVDTLRDEYGVLNILDVNARFWGSLRGTLMAGVNFPYLACLSALNIPFEAPCSTPARYFHSKTALRQFLLRLLGKNLNPPITLREAGLVFLFSDPLAELTRIYAQEILDL